MSVKQTVVPGVLLAIAFVGGVVTGQTERFELEGNLKFFGAGNGVIFPNGTKQTSAFDGTATDLACKGCVDSGEIVANAVGSAQVAADSLAAGDLAANSVTSSEIAADAVGASEIAAGAVGTSEVADKSLGLSKLAATVFMNQTMDLFNTVINSGNCSSFIATAASGAAAGSFGLVFGVRPASGGANPGGVMEGEDSPTGVAGTIKVRICKFTGGAAEAPNLRFNFWTIGQ